MVETMTPMMDHEKFMDALFVLFPDITTNKCLLNKRGNISITRLVKFVKFDNSNGETYDEFYEYLEENKHMYEWWIL